MDLIDYLQKEKTIKGEYEYYANLLQRLSEKKVLFHQDNAPVHTFVIATAKINELKFELLPRTTYSPDLATSNCFLFPKLKKWHSGKRFANNEEVESAVNGYFEELLKHQSYYFLMTLFFIGEVIGQGRHLQGGFPYLFIHDNGAIKRMYCEGKRFELLAELEDTRRALIFKGKLIKLLC